MKYMNFLGTVPRRCVNLPPGSLWTLLSNFLSGSTLHGPDVDQFSRRFEEYLGSEHVFGVAQGRSAFDLALRALDLEEGSEIIFPVFTFPVMPLVAKLLGFKPVFCDVDPVSFNAQAKHIEACITERTSAVLATHLFGQPCHIVEIAALTKKHGIRLLEDCAHACGLRIDGKQAGTFGDIGVFSFAEGKNMPCLGGGAIAVKDSAVAERAGEILAGANEQDSGTVFKKGLATWVKWLLTRPLVFGLSAYPVLRLKLATGTPLMDSAVGNELLSVYAADNPGVVKMANLQGAIGLRQLKHIDAFNEGARKNAVLLSQSLDTVKGIGLPPAGADHIDVYYPIAVAAEKRDGLRNYLLRQGIDGKITDMSDCSQLDAFRQETGDDHNTSPKREAALLEICVYPVISTQKIKRIARVIRAWSEVPS
ncbi:MAG: DegT/DnrJ/EryC1/StrS aminotransferase family protein [Halioglobus sp.]